MSLQDYEIISKLGSGSFGVVHKARDKKTNNICVIKIVDISNMNAKLRKSVNFSLLRPLTKAKFYIKWILLTLLSISIRSFINQPCILSCNTVQKATWLHTWNLRWGNLLNNRQFGNYLFKWWSGCEICTLRKFCIETSKHWMCF